MTTSWTLAVQAGQTALSTAKSGLSTAIGTLTAAVAGHPGYLNYWNVTALTPPAVAEDVLLLQSAVAAVVAAGRQCTTAVNALWSQSQGASDGTDPSGVLAALKAIESAAGFGDPVVLLSATTTAISVLSTWASTLI